MNYLFNVIQKKREKKKREHTHIERIYSMNSNNKRLKLQKLVEIVIKLLFYFFFIKIVSFNKLSAAK